MVATARTRDLQALLSDGEPTVAAQRHLLNSGALPPEPTTTRAVGPVAFRHEQAVPGTLIRQLERRGVIRTAPALEAHRSATSSCLARSEEHTSELQSL